MNDHQELLRKMAAGTSTAEERTAFQAWLQTLSVQGYRQVMMDYEEMIAEQESGNYDPVLLERVNERIDGTATPLKKWRSGYRYAAAAAVLLVAMLAVWRWMLPSKSVQPLALKTVQPGSTRATLVLGNGQTIVLDSLQSGWQGQQGAAQVTKSDSGLLSYRVTGSGGAVMYNTLTTPRGGYFKVLLPDGSQVWLNAASSLRYPNTFTGNERTIYLTGEAYFDISSNVQQPFIVKTRHSTVEVLGTSFNVMAYEEEKMEQTTLVSGAIKAGSENGMLLLKPGQQAVMADGAAQPQLLSANIEAVTAWKNGQFFFEDTDIHAIMRQVARWYDVEIVYENNLSDIRLSGVVSRKEYISQLLEILEATGKVHFNIQGTKLIVHLRKN
ncbi:FecR family protein [Chitinophaga flava]|uniref:Anti-sigma factor n=1 Tax=Chitinophaga flava TaxID=2259036 RepID=A0A365XTA3_9BACT|nr:FecR family protein [Chitinophaga flava]RBL88944.1 anti-sigma factor [Chitinophaga flava]